ncbi:MAG: hypothetical protein DSY80_01375, partial [Desulfocapsa sp.]
MIIPVQLQQQTPSIHGTAISLMQHPSDTTPGVDRGKVLLTEEHMTSMTVPALPAYYTEIPPVTLMTKEPTTQPGKLNHVPITNDVQVDLEAHQENYIWLESVEQLASTDVIDDTVDATWAAHHASHLPDVCQPHTIIALLPLFCENANSIAMILHAMNVVKSSVNHLNPGQTPILTMDQPLYARAKQIQWNWPDTHGEDHYIVMFGGLHIEIATLKTLGCWLSQSGWTSAIVQANIASPGKADSFLTASNVKRTRRAHEITAASLYILQRMAYNNYIQLLDGGDTPTDFTTWCSTKYNMCPQFRYWATTLEFELKLLQFIRSLREGNFRLYIEALEQLIPWFFALDRVHYSRWLPLHIRDMKELVVRHPCTHNAFLDGHFVARKTSRKFSGIALDQAHEQLNDLIKGDGGAVGLTENPSALRRWVLAGPEVARVINEFDVSFHHFNKLEDRRNHEQVPETQKTFIKNVKALVATFVEMGNPFEEDSVDLIVLDTREIMDSPVIDTVNHIEEIGQNQYTRYIDERLDHRIKAIFDPITRNNLPLFSSPPARKSKMKSQVISLKNDCILFSRLYIACQSRDGNLEEFFKHENRDAPPALSQAGKLRIGTKSDIVDCLSKVVLPVSDAPQIDAKVLDGSVIVHLLQPGTAKTFQEYADQIFKQYILTQLETVKRLDIIWDVYRPDSLKQGVRESRGKGTRRRVKATTAVPGNWESFLRVNDNKSELYDFLGQYSIAITTPGKEIYSTCGESVLCSTVGNNTITLAPCSHEEADSRIMLHVA